MNLTMIRKIVSGYRTRVSPSPECCYSSKSHEPEEQELMLESVNRPFCREMFSPRFQGDQTVLRGI